MAHDVFISHSSKDKPIADAVCANLESRGVRCWIAPRDIRAGENWGEAIVRGIKGSRIMVLVLSSHANDSPQVEREVQRAFERNVTVIPFRVENVQPSEGIEYYVGSVHWLDALTPPLDQHISRLTDTIRRILSEENPTEKAPDAGENTANTSATPAVTPDYKPAPSVSQESAKVETAPTTPVRLPDFSPVEPPRAAPSVPHLPAAQTSPPHVASAAYASSAPTSQAPTPPYTPPYGTPTGYVSGQEAPKKTPPYGMIAAISAIVILSGLLLAGPLLRKPQMNVTNNHTMSDGKSSGSGSSSTETSSNGGESNFGTVSNEKSVSNSNASMSGENSNATPDKNVTGEQAPSDIRAAMESAYNQIDAAMTRKDISAYKSLVSTDFTQKKPGGEEQTYSSYMASMTLVIALAKSIQYDSKILTVQPKGQDVVVTVRINSRLEVEGGLGNQSTSEVDKDTWTRSGGKWMLKHTDIVSAQQ